MATVLGDDQQPDQTPDVPADPSNASGIPELDERLDRRPVRRATQPTPVTSPAGDQQTPFGLILDPGQGDTPSAVSGYFFTLDDQGKIINDTSIPTGRILEAARHSGLPVFVRQNDAVYRGYLDASGQNVRKLNDDRPITPDSNLARSLAMTGSQQQALIERHLDQPTEGSGGNQQPALPVEPSTGGFIPGAVSLPTARPLPPITAGGGSVPRATELRPGSSSAESPDATITVGGTMARSPGEPEAQSSAVFGEETPAVATELPRPSESEVSDGGIPPLSTPISPAEPATRIASASVPAAPEQPAEFPVETIPPEVAGAAIQPSRQAPSRPAAPSADAIFQDSAETASPSVLPVPPVISSLPGEPVIDRRQASPAYVELGGTPRPQRRRRISPNRPATTVPSAIGSTTSQGEDGDFGASPSAVSPTSAPGSPAPQTPRIQQAGRVSRLSRSDAVPAAVLSSTDGNTSNNGPISPVYTDVIQGKQPTVRPQPVRRETPIAPTEDASLDEEIDKPEADQFAQPTQPTAPDTGGGRILRDESGDQGYTPFIQPAGAQQFADQKPEPSLEEFEAAEEDPEKERQKIWSEDLAQQKLQRLKALRRSVARTEVAQATDDQLDDGTPTGALTPEYAQAAAAANRYTTQAVQARASRYGTIRALRNAQGKSQADVEVLAQAEARQFLLAAQRRSWQVAQEIAEDAALSFADFMIITGPVASGLYISRWVVGNMFGSMVSIEVGGISIPAVPGYSIGDMLDYERHVKFLLIGTWTVILWGFIAMLLYFMANWGTVIWNNLPTTFDTLFKAGWKALVDLLGTF